MNIDGYPKYHCRSPQDGGGQFMNIDGYPKYHCRSPQDGGGQFMKRRINQTNWCEMDNRNVIPYNAFLLKTLNCHINVEYCSSIKSIQYLFKYQYKGNDEVTMFLNQKHSVPIQIPVQR